MSFEQKPLANVLNRLPIGVEVLEGDQSSPVKRIARNIKFRKLSHTDLKAIHDKTFAKNHPALWLARLCSFVIESIDNIPVYEDYKSHGLAHSYVPSIVGEIPYPDVNYVLYAGHIYNFGTLVKDNSFKCVNPVCNKINTSDIDISHVMCDITDDSFHEIEIVLEDGINYKSDEVTDPNVYTKMIFSIPTLKDVVKREKSFKLNEQGTFLEEIYGDCLKSLIANNGQMFPEDRLRLLKDGVFKFITANDSSIIERDMNELPGLTYTVIEICKHCSEDIPVFVEQSFLYPRRKS